MFRIPMLRARRFASALAVAALAAAPAPAAIINVGNGSGCETNSFPAAFGMAFISPEAD